MHQIAGHIYLELRLTIDAEAFSVSIHSATSTDAFANMTEVLGERGYSAQLLISAGTRQ